MNEQQQIDASFREIADRLRNVADRDIEIVAVTKGFGPDALLAAASAGVRSVGENYVQELIGKLDHLGADPAHAAAIEPLRIHMIGQLQTNKVRQLAGRVDRYDTVDRAKLAREIARRDPGAAVLIQVDTTGEPGKGGVPIVELEPLVDTVRELGLDLRGLMTVGPTGGGPAAARTGFVEVRAAADRLGLDVCSMGMSADFEVAAELGATEVRIGSALFGPRDR